MIAALEQAGFARRLAAEALKQTDNDQARVMTILTDPVRCALLQSSLEMDSGAPSRRERQSLDADVSACGDCVNVI